MADTLSECQATMASINQKITEWVKQISAIDPDNGQVDYLAIQTKQGKLFPESAKSRVAGRNIETVCNEVDCHVNDIIESWQEERRQSGAIRIRAFKDGSPAGSKTYQWGIPFDEAESDAGSIKDEAALVIRELRLLSADQGNHLVRMSSAGWEMAGKLLEQNVGLSTENASLKAKQTDVMDKLVEHGGPAIPLLLATLVEEFQANREEKRLEKKERKEKQASNGAS